jgi:hypothetical protein
MVIKKNKQIKAPPKDDGVIAVKPKSLDRRKSASVERKNTSPPTRKQNSQGKSTVEKK